MTEEINVKEINDRYIELWKEYENKVDKVPSLLPELKTNTLLFIGINPSCSYLEEKLETIGSDLTTEEFLEWTYSLTEEKREEIKDERRVSRGQDEESAYGYFKPFYKISRDVMNDEHEWEHLDVFRTIASNEEDLTERLKMNSEGKELSEFGEKQFEFFHELLKKLNPQIIVVQNAKASKIIKHRLNINDNNFRKKQGFHIKKVNKRDVPIFFSGMLSGHRALDTGSKKRLIWHIKKAKEWIDG